MRRYPPFNVRRFRNMAPRLGGEVVGGVQYGDADRARVLPDDHRAVRAARTRPRVRNGPAPAAIAARRAGGGRLRHIDRHDRVLSRASRARRTRPGAVRPGEQRARSAAHLSDDLHLRLVRESRSAEALRRCYHHLAPGGALVFNVHLPYQEADRWNCWLPEHRRCPRLGPTPACAREQRTGMRSSFVRAG